jgi:hypothetical protein
MFWRKLQTQHFVGSNGIDAIKRYLREQWNNALINLVVVGTSAV